MTDLPTVEALRAESVAFKLDEAAKRLARQAERLTEWAKHIRAMPGLPSALHMPYSTLAAEMVNDIVATMSNINLGGFATAGAEADAARTAGE